jgi:hypothetical protein
VSSARSRWTKAGVGWLAHGAAANVLIIGAGDGGVLRRVLQHRGDALDVGVGDVHPDDTGLDRGRRHRPVRQITRVPDMPGLLQTH